MISFRVNCSTSSEFPDNVEPNSNSRLSARLLIPTAFEWRQVQCALQGSCRLRSVQTTRSSSAQSPVQQQNRFGHVSPSALLSVRPVPSRSTFPRTHVRERTLSAYIGLPALSARSCPYTRRFFARCMGSLRRGPCARPALLARRPNLAPALLLGILLSTDERRHDLSAVLPPPLPSPRAVRRDLLHYAQREIARRIESARPAIADAIAISVREP